MIIYGASPLANVHPSLYERAGRELQTQLGSIGARLDFESADGNAIRLNISSVNPSDAALVYGVLEAWGVQRVDLEPADVPVFLGGTNAFSIGIARGLQSRIPGIVDLLTEIQPSEISDAIDRAMSFVVNDRAPEGLSEALHRGAHADLVQHGVMNSMDDGRGWLRALEERSNPEPRIYPEFEAEYKPYRGAFD